MPSTAGSGERRPASRSAAPRVPLPRTRLQPFLDRVPATPLSVLDSPAGTGKTAAVQAWASRHPEVDVRWCEAGRVGSLVGGVAGRPSRVVVVDDAQQLTTAGMDHLVDIVDADGSPTRVLLVGRRGVPAIPLALQLAGGAQVASFRDLALDDAEAGSLARLHHARATPGQIAALVAESRGWAASLVLGGSVLAVSAGSSRVPALHYLESEVLATGDPALRDLLLQVATEADVDADDVLALAGPRGSDLLAAAATQGFLVIGRPGPVHGWTFHPLLVELVRSAVRQDAPDRAPYVSGRRRVTLHHLRRGDPRAALHHARLSEDPDLVADAVLTAIPDLLLGTDTQPVASALASVPTSVRDGHPRLLVADALLAWATGDPSGAKPAGDRVLAAPDEHLSGAASPRGFAGIRDAEVDVALIEVWHARVGWRPVAPALARAAAALRCDHQHGRDGLPDTHDLTDASPVRAAWLMLSLAGLETWADRLDTAAAHVRAAGTEADRAGLPPLKTAVLASRASLELALGLHRAAGDTAQASLEHGAAGPVETRDLLIRGIARFCSCDIPGAQQDLDAVRGDAQRAHDPFDIAYVRFLEAAILIGTGRLAEGRRLLEADAVLPHPVPSYVERLFTLFRLGAAAAMGDLASVRADAARLTAAGFTADARWAESLDAGLSGDELGALRLLDSLLSSQPLAGGTDGQGEVSRVTTALAATTRVALLLRAGTEPAREQARRLVPDLLARVVPQGLHVVLSSGGLVTDGLADLLTHEATREGGHPQAASALRSLDRLRAPYLVHTEDTHRPDPVRAPTTARTTPDRPAADLLTRRELEVLRAVAGGASNSEVSDALYISENTVKTHLASLFRKLDVTGRRDAVRVARQRQLL